MPRMPSDPFDERTSATLASSVFEKLRWDILEGVVRPGEKLRIEALRERYRVGASPLREALNRLSALHLVEQIDQRGFRVAPVTEEGMRELAQTRCWISEIAIRESILHGDAAWEEGVVLAYHRLWRCQEADVGQKPSREWQVLHRAYHSALIAACPSHWIREFHESLFDLADRERHLNTRMDHAPRDGMAEHKAIMEAVVTRDVALATRLLNSHILRTTEIAEEIVKAHAEVPPRETAAA